MDRVDRVELERLDRQNLISRAEELGVVRANVLTRPELVDEILLRTSRENGDALMNVADTGVGISDEDQRHVFERFFRADKARSREAGGSGLGLAICQSIVEAHHGSITFTSRPGEGTTFAVRLPLLTNGTAAAPPRDEMRHF